MIINRPSIDWLTLTTFNLKSALLMDRLMGEIVGQVNTKVNTKESRYLMYDGVIGDQFFVGTATQNGKDHHLFRFSGDLADAVGFNPLRPSMDCSRIDLQMTMPVTEDTYTLFASAEPVISQHEGSGGRGKRGRKVNVILSPDGMCTLYVGNRQSERLYRIYVKEHSGDLFLRFEVEYKSKSGLAGRIYREISKDPVAIVGYLVGELDTLPDHDLITGFKTQLKGVPADIMRYEKRLSDPNTTLLWLTKQVLPAFRRMLGNEDTRDRATMLLNELNRFAESAAD